jgi:hypothetical protein
MRTSALFSSFILLASAVMGCGSRTELELFAWNGDATGRGASAGTSSGGASGSGGSLVTGGATGSGGSVSKECLTARVGHAFVSDSGPDLAYVMLQSFIDDEYNILEIVLDTPSSGAFDLATLENQNAGTCSECISVKRFQNDIWDRVFVAQEGSLEVAALAHVEGSSAGRLSAAVLREATIDPASGASSLVPDGECLRIEAAEWQTAACQVGNACPEDMECLGTYYSTNGACVPRGGKAYGEACSSELSTTDCQAGMDCTYGLCRPTCNFWSGTEACPSGLLCNADSRCINGADSAALGETCTNGEWAFCGAEGERYAGQCIERDGAVTCGRLCRDYYDCATSCDPIFETALYGTCTP